MSSPPATRRQQRRLSKKEQIARSREIARIRREQAVRRRRRNRVLLVAGLAVAVLVVGGAVVLGEYHQAQERLRGPANMGSDGILLTGDGSAATAVRGDGVAPGADPVATRAADYAQSPYVVLYLDYADPRSATLVQTAAADLEQYLAAGYVTLEIHPVALSDSGRDDYSSRAANALACVAEYAPDQFLAVSDALLKAAAADDFEHPADDALDVMVQQAGVTDSDVDSCISDGRFRPWVEAATDRATTRALPNSEEGPLTSTPLALVDGDPYTGDPTDADAFNGFLASQYQAEQGGD